jgi:chaperone modulatory protein CbpM
MAQRKYVTVEEFSRFHQLDLTIIHEFIDFGLVEVHQVDEEACLPAEDLERVERLTRLYRELDINKEGIDIILHLREQLVALQEEKEALQYRLQQLEQERQHLLHHSPQRRTIIIDIEPFDL